MKKCIVLLLTVFIATAFCKVYGNNGAIQEGSIDVILEEVDAPRSIGGHVERLKITFCEDLGMVLIRVKSVSGEVLYNNMVDAKSGTTFTTIIPANTAGLVIEIANETGIIVSVKV